MIILNVSKRKGGGDVGQLTFTIIEPDQPFEIGSTIVIPLPGNAYAQKIQDFP